jgi:glycine/D-amino acid oxidase-like deaminating enzyme
VSAPVDVAIIGGGIVGCAAAAFLAEAGVRVELYERDEVGSAASGRNSGSVQHPFDQVMAGLHAETLDHYRELDDLDFPDSPAGVLLLSEHPTLLEPTVDEIVRAAPELTPTVLEPDELHGIEPAVADDLWACRLDTGYTVRPLAATRAFARRAFAAGVRFLEHETAWPWVASGRIRGVLSAGVRRPFEAVLVAAGPWTPELVDPTHGWRPIAPLWGVVAEVDMAEPPRHVLEEVGVEAVAAGAGESIFSLVAADGQVSVGSTFLSEAPDPAVWAGPLRRGGVRWVPALERARITGARACPRPQSFDGRPLVGQLPDAEGLWVVAGHGPWGISTGPATARIAVDAMLGRGEIPAPLSVSRF